MEAKNRDNVLVSVIIPTHNRKELLGEAVESCLKQIWQPLEVIIVDDGSTDGTGGFVQQMVAGPWSAKKIVYHYQNNAGASAARNAGLSIASGDYVQFLDSDDILFKEKLALQVECLENPSNRNAKGCSCFGRMGSALSDADCHQIGVKCQNTKEYIRILSSRIVHGMQTSAPLWRREFLTSQAGWRTDISYGDDLEYHIRLLAADPQLQFVDKDLFFVREHSGPRLSDAYKNRERTLSAIRTRKSVWKSISDSGNWDVETQTNFLAAVRSIYANILDCGTENDIREFEALLIIWSSVPQKRIFFRLTVLLRRVFGSRLVLTVHKAIMTLRGRK